VEIELGMSRGNRSWKVRDDYIDLVKAIATQKYGRQEDLAERIGFARSTVSKYLNGRLVDIAKFREISFFLGFSDANELACLPNGQILAEITLIESPAELTLSSAARTNCPPSKHHFGWGEELKIEGFYGRTDEVNLLAQWILEERCHVVALLGLGGMGKTTLAYKLVEQIRARFDYTIWRSLRQAPPLDEILTDLLKFINPDPDFQLPETVKGKISELIQALQRFPCLIILDNMESILASGAVFEETPQRAGSYREGYEDYGELIQQIGELSHQSCLVLTSREKPQEIALLSRADSLARSLTVGGLDAAAAQNILQNRQMEGTADDLERLTQRYAGCPLALNFAASDIQDLFAGSISEFLAAGTSFFGHIGALLDIQSPLAVRTANYVLVGDRSRTRLHRRTQQRFS
jgi:transcriptional regulator with XRE-family HTH domain